MIHRYPASDTISLANKLLVLSGDREELLKFGAKQRDHVEELSWKRVGRHFIDLAHAYVDAVKTERMLSPTSSEAVSTSGARA